MCARNAAVNKVSTEQVLNKAYRLAYFLHQDKSTAIRIVAAATLKLNVAMAVQSKRLYYIPVGRFSRGESRRTDGIRNKALFSDLHLLQRLIYVESEPYERQKERAAQPAPPGVLAAGDPATGEDLLVYFIKHLVRITTKRNAFYVTLGVSRLLHSYSTHETMEIYNAVIGEPERVKDDYYYRSRKAVLMHEMYQRFGQLIRARRQQRGEERFETQQGSSELRSLFRECLRLFTPWDTQCHVPRDFDPLKSVITALTSRSSADENEIEVSRIHAILHPDCFEKLVAAFRYGPPAERLELPRFFADHSDDQSPPRQRSAPGDLSAEELAEINHMLDEQSGRRRHSSPGAAIRIMVDGVERARIDPAEQSSISFSAEEDAELIEVKTTDADGDLLLATYLLTSFAKDARDATTVASIRLEGGQQLSLSIARRSSDADGEAGFMVKFGYQETYLRRALRLWWRRLGLRLTAEQGLTARHVLAGSVVVVICVASYLVYVRLKSHQTTGPAETSVAQATPVIQQPSFASSPTAEPSASQPVRVAKNDRSTAPKRPASSLEGETRSANVIPNLTLRQVKKIYIEIRGDAASNDLRSNLVESLNSSGVVTVSTNTDDADAALKIVVSQISTSAQLVNARGTVLWRYSGSDIVKNLLSAIKK
ncbi:MAG TPA: hypothetical protein VFS90_01190 [Pyrinomonadaceae bacterium]|nr:hypothetical protein [Pyrinomonadaceae bacterium]